MQSVMTNSTIPPIAPVLLPILRTITVTAVGLAVVALTPVAAHAAGPISAADREFLATVHSVASFAVSASNLAQTKASTGPVRTIGKTILQQDRVLDGMARSAASRLQIPLPSPAPPALEKLQAAEGETFDAGYVDRLRATDGTLLQLAATIRVNTRNDLVRNVAHQTTTTVMAQLPMLESSGLVDFQTLAAAPQPTPTPTLRSGPNADPVLLAAARRREGFLTPSVRVNVAVLGGAGLIALIATWRVITGRRPRRAR